MDFLKYQNLRQLIRDIGYKPFLKLIGGLPDDMQIGLAREYRAYYWLKKKYPNDKVAITNMFEDKEGKDIVIERNTKILYFAVSGPSDKEKHSNCDYKIIVTDKTIYQKAIEKESDEPN